MLVSFSSSVTTTERRRTRPRQCSPVLGSILGAFALAPVDDLVAFGQVATGHQNLAGKGVRYHAQGAVARLAVLAA
eukprot:2340279-Ditylum_brightwellii.AAC.1